jgi:hypothetical protein
MTDELGKDSIPQSVAAFVTYKRYLQHLELALTKTFGTEPALGRGVGDAVDSLLPSGTSVGNRSNPSYALRLAGNWERRGTRRAAFEFSLKSTRRGSPRCYGARRLTATSRFITARAPGSPRLVSHSAHPHPRSPCAC